MRSGLPLGSWWVLANHLCYCDLCFRSLAVWCSVRGTPGGAAPRCLAGDCGSLWGRLCRSYDCGCVPDEDPSDSLGVDVVVFPGPSDGVLCIRALSRKGITLVTTNHAFERTVIGLWLARRAREKQCAPAPHFYCGRLARRGITWALAATMSIRPSLATALVTIVLCACGACPKGQRPRNDALNLAKDFAIESFRANAQRTFPVSQLTVRGERYQSTDRFWYFTISSFDERCVIEVAVGDCEAVESSGGGECNDGRLVTSAAQRGR
jgi:hypothetical protein